MRSLLGRFHRPMSRGLVNNMLTMNNLGDGSTLSLDFTTMGGVLDPRLTFTRSTTATYINSSGYVTSAAINAPRFDYSPTNIGQPRGLLIEGSSINYMLQSVTLDPHNVIAMRTISTASITDPEGTTTKARIIAADGTTGYHARHLATTASTNTTITISIFAKKNGYKYLFFAEIGSGRSAVRFDLDDGTTSNSSGAGFVSATATQYAAGWWRCSMVVNVTASTSYAWSYVGVPTTGATLGIYGAQYTGTNTDTDGIYCYGFSVEAGSGASSYIPTGASQVTRNADDCTITGTNFSSWYNPNEGSTLIQWTGGSGQNNVDGRSHTFLNSTQTHQIFEGSGFALNVYSTTFQAQIGNGIGSLNSTAKIASAFKAADFATSVNGSNAVVQSSGTMPTLVDRLSIGSNYLNAGTFKFVCIKQFKYYPVRLSNAQLKSLSTP